MFVLLRCRGEHEICFWSEIIWIREVKLREMLYQVLARDSVIKIRCHDVPFRGFSFYMQKKKKQGRSLLKSYSFRCKRSIHALFGKYTIPESIFITIIIITKMLIIITITIFITTCGHKWWHKSCRQQARGSDESELLAPPGSPPSPANRGLQYAFVLRISS